MVLKRIFGIGGKGKDVDIDKYLTDMVKGNSETAEESGIIYVKPIDINSDGNLDTVLKEIEKNNIVVLSIRKIFNDKAHVRHVIRELNDRCTSVGSDMARISDEKILVVPKGVRISHRSK